MVESGRAAVISVLGLFWALACGDHRGPRKPPPGEPTLHAGAGSPQSPAPIDSTVPAGSGGAPSNRTPMLGGTAGVEDPPGTAAAAGASAAAAGGGALVECTNATSAASAANGVHVYSQWDELGYAPYALSGCALAYVAPDGSLWLRDLTDGNERQLDASDQKPRRPSISADVVAWEVFTEDKSAVRVFHAGRTVTLSGSFHHAGEPRTAGGTVAFSAWTTAERNGDTDVMLYDAANGSVALAIGGRGQQRFADVSAEYVAASDFSESPDGFFDGLQSPADLVLLDRRTGSRVSRLRPGKQAFPLLGNDGALAYLEWGFVHPEPKFDGYALWLGRVDGAPEGDILISEIRTRPSYVRPSLRDDVIDFVNVPSGGVASLHRVNVATPAVLVPVALEGTLLGPVSTPDVTMIGTQLGAVVQLRVIPR